MHVSVDDCTAERATIASNDAKIKNTILCFLQFHWLFITSNYRQIWLTNQRISFVLSSIVKVVCEQKCIVNSVRVDD